MPYLSALIPTTDLIAYYALEEITADDYVGSLTDSSGNARTLTATAAAPDRPSGLTNSLNGQPLMLFASCSPLLNTTSPPVVKDIYVLAKYTLAANFGGAYRGLISGETAGDALTGDSAGSSTKFTNFGTGTSTYYKSQTAYAAAAQEAPFTNFELIRLSDTAGMTFDGIQIGNQRAFARKWHGYVGDIVLYSSVQSTANARRLALYYDLKFGLWRINSTTLYFPDPTTTGIDWARFDDEPKPWDGVTVSHEYDDGGRSFNTITDTPARFWEIGFTGLSPEEAEIFDAFNDAARRDRTFSLIDKYGDTQTGLRIASYSRGHEGHKSWSKSATFRLVKYP